MAKLEGGPELAGDDRAAAEASAGRDLQESYRWMMGRTRFTADQLRKELDGGEWSAQRVMAVLQSARLIKPVQDFPESYSAVSPEVAAADTTESIEVEIERLREQATRTRESLREFLEERLEGGSGGVLEVLGTTEDAAQAIAVAARSCLTEMSEVEIAAPAGAAAAEEALVRCRQLTRRRVQVRSLHLHSARAQRSTQGHLARLVNAGAEVRTTRHIIERMTVFDREIVFLPDRHGGQGVTVVRHPVVVGVLCSWLDNAWATGAPFAPGDVGYATSLSDMHQAILEMLSNGLKDELIARRLRISLRTCRRHIADLMVELGASSRFQAGVNAVRLRDWL